MEFHMPIKAKIYWILAVTAGITAFGTSIGAVSFRENALTPFILYLCAAVAVSRLKVKLPGVLVTLSVNYVVIMTALLNLPLAGAMLVGIASALGQSFVFARQKPKWFQAMFNACAIPLPIIAAGFALQLKSLRETDASGLLSLTAASLAYYFVNTIAVAGMVSLSGNAKVFSNWRNSYLWTFPQYLAGGAIAGGVHFLQALIGWSAILLGIPAVVLVYLSYRIYMERVERLEEVLRVRQEQHTAALRSAIEATSDPRMINLLERHLLEMRNEAREDGRLGVSPLVPA